MRVHLLLVIDPGNMTGREFEALRDDLRAYAKTHVEASGGKLVGSYTEPTKRTKKRGVR